MQKANQSHYFLPDPSYWPLMGCVGILTFFIGAANWLHYHWLGPYLLSLGVIIILVMMAGWFSRVIHENRTDSYNSQVSSSFKLGMSWFIFSEVLFFGGLFGTLFYTRLWSVPELGGEIYPLTNILLWPDFVAQWPLLKNPENYKYLGAKSVGNVWGIPALNTLLLLTSGATLMFAHWGLVQGKRKILVSGLILSILLGITFLLCQSHEYYQAYTIHGLTLNAGSYGSTFFILTGFHGIHVTIGATMLSVILFRSLAGHFSTDNHFAFRAVAWYWHFVDIVWLFLFVFVYWW